MPPTIKDVAAHAGVSTATVSRALSGARPVRSDLAARVEQAVVALGYSGNVIASSLRRSRTDTIGMVVPDITNPFFTSLVKNLEHVLAVRDWQLFLCDSQSDPAIEAARLESLIARRVDGIVISPCNEISSAAAVKAAAAAVPVVQVDRIAKDTQTDWVGIDDDVALSLLVEHLAGLDVRSAAFVSSRQMDSSTELRRAAFLRHAERWGIAVEPAWIKLGDYSAEWGRQAAVELLAEDERPQAIVCAADLIGLGVLQSCRDDGVRVPDDVIVTGFDDIPFAAMSSPPLTTVAQPLGRMAAEAVRLLEIAMKREVEEITRTSFGPELIVRQSSFRGGS
jgi:LacI family transcriptional regulator